MENTKQGTSGIFTVGVTYTTATSEKRIDIIIKNYTEFIGIVDEYTDGLRYMIESAKESNYRQSLGDHKGSDRWNAK